MYCPVCREQRPELGAAYISHVNCCPVPPAAFLFAPRLHAAPTVSGFGPPPPAPDAWPTPPQSLAPLTPSQRAIVVRGGPSYSLSPEDYAEVHAEGGWRLLLGSEAVSRSAPGLQAAGVRAIVNCAGNSQPLAPPERTAAGIEFYAHLDFIDRAVVEGQDPLSLIERGADAIVDALAATGASGGVLVHCVAGVSRSASVCMAFLVKHRGASLLDAATRVKTARSVVYPNHGVRLPAMGACAALQGFNPPLPILPLPPAPPPPPPTLKCRPLAAVLGGLAPAGAAHARVSVRARGRSGRAPPQGALPPQHTCVRRRVPQLAARI